MNIKTTPEEAPYPLQSQGSQTVSNKDVFQPVNVGMKSNRAGKFKIYKHGRKHKSSERFNYFMRKVISSVDAPLAAQTTLGIQSIIIGSHPHRAREEVKDYTQDISKIAHRTRLEPLPESSKIQQRLSSTINKVLNDEQRNTSRSDKQNIDNKMHRTSTEELGEWIQESIKRPQKQISSDKASSLKHKNEENEDEQSRIDEQDEIHSETVSPQYDNNTTKQVAELMHLANTTNRIFIPVKKAEKDEDDPTDSIYTEEKDPPMNHEGTVVFSKQGFIKVGKGRHEPSDYISHDNFILNGINKQIFSNLPLFKKFPLLKIFKQWKFNTNNCRYLRKREMLCKNLILSKPQFAEGFASVTCSINEIKDLKFLEIKKNAIFGRKQQSLLEK